MWIGRLIVVSIAVCLADGAGECCNAYTDDFTGDYLEEVWCSNYCCDYSNAFMSQNTYEVECCDNVVYQADDSKKTRMCSLWWSNNAWAPALIAIALIAICVGVAVLVHTKCIKKKTKVSPVQTPRVAQSNANNNPAYNPHQMGEAPPGYTAMQHPSAPHDPYFDNMRAADDQYYSNLQAQNQPSNNTTSLPPQFNGNRNPMLPPISGPGAQTGASNQPGAIGQPGPPAGPALYGPAYPGGPGYPAGPSGPGYPAGQAGPAYPQPGGSQIPPSYEQSGMASYGNIPQKKAHW